MAATRSIADLPGPPGLPLLGNSHQLRGESQHVTIERWHERYGPIYRFGLGPRDVVAIGDVDAINTILRARPEGFRRWRERQRAFHEMGIRAVFPAEGDDWRRQRRLAVTALNSHHLQRYFHVIRTAVARLYRLVREAAREGRTLEIAHELTSFTIDVTSALAFGVDLNTLERGDEQLQTHIQRVFEMLARRTLAPVPYWRVARLPADRSLERSLTTLHGAIAGFVQEARERMSTRPELFESPENLLESMLAAQHADGSFSDEEIAGNALCFLIAGEDTTAHTIAWTVWFLAQMPDVQARLALEAREVLGEEPLPAGYEAIQHLHYGEAVLRESLRLKPVIVASTVEPIADTTIAQTHVPAGTRLWLSTRPAGLGSDTIPHAGEFDPERWLQHGDVPACDSAQVSERVSLLAFGAGPRFCPGRNLAFLESQSALAMLARNFELELDEHAIVQERFNTTVIPHGLRVLARERVL